MEGLVQVREVREGEIWGVRAVRRECVVGLEVESVDAAVGWMVGYCRQGALGAEG